MTRRFSFAASAAALTIACLISVPARAQDTGRAIIIDSADSTKRYIGELADMGVAAIGRYYARCPQWTPNRKARIVGEKRMIDNPDELEAIFKDPRLGLLSVYQFYSQADKFDTKRASGKVTVLDDRPRKADAKTVQDFNDCITPAKPNTIEEDATLDGYAAVTQAKEIVKQPPGTAIYFGVDFDLNADRQANVMTYFRIIHKLVTDAGYVMGVYGNGAISDLLRGENPTKEKLVEYVWLTASPAHAGSANTYNVKHWDLLQTKTDTKWAIKDKTFGLDTNMQNPASPDIGFWKKDGPHILPHERNVTVHAARRFVCEGKPVIFNDAGKRIAKVSCTKTYGIVVRTFETNAAKKLVQVDCDEDGKPDGWIAEKDISAKRPVWVSDTRGRSTAHCAAP